MYMTNLCCFRVSIELFQNTHTHFFCKTLLFPAWGTWVRFIKYFIGSSGPEGSGFWTIAADKLVFKNQCGPCYLGKPQKVLYSPATKRWGGGGFSDRASKK